MKLMKRVRNKRIFMRKRNYCKQCWKNDEEIEGCWRCLWKKEICGKV